jgi:hypothetical protein
MYGNVYNLKGTEIKDVKFYSNPLHNSKASQITEDSIFISTQDESFKDLYAATFKDILSKPSSVEG